MVSEEAGEEGLGPFLLSPVLGSVDIKTLWYSHSITSTLSIILMSVFAVGAILVEGRIILLLCSSSRSIRHKHTWLLLIFVLCGALGRVGFFVGTYFEPSSYGLYYFLWFFPEMFYIAACVLFIRMWMRLFATKRGVNLFPSRLIKSLATFIEITFLILMTAIQTSLFVVMLSSQENFDKYQAADAYFIFSIEMLLVLAILTAIIGVKAIEIKDREHPWRVSLFVFARRFDRVDAVMVVWGLGRLFRGLDGMLMMQKDLSNDLASREYSYIYIICFYVFVEFMPIVCLTLIDKVIETLDFGNDFNYFISQIAEGERGTTVSAGLAFDIAEEGGYAAVPYYTYQTNNTSIYSSRKDSDRDKGRSPTLNVQEEEGDWIENLKKDPTFKNKLINYKDLKILEYEGRVSGGTRVKAQWGDKVVSVKRLDVILQKGDDLKPFYNELTVLRVLRHPKIVSFYGAAIEPPNVYFITEYFKWDNLRTVLEDESVRIDFDLLGRMARDICKGLLAMHNENIVHRDLKPQSVMVDSDFHVKIGEFGHIKIIEGTVKAPMSVAGSSIYIAPEVYCSHYTPKADIFSFGMILWEMYTRSVTRLQPGQIINGKRPSIPQECPIQLKNLIKLCWNQDPDQRPTAEEMLNTLKSWKSKSKAKEKEKEKEKEHEKGKTDEEEGL